MKSSYYSLALIIALFLGCGANQKAPVAPSETEKTGKIIVNVTWPQSALVKKDTNVLREPPDKITAYLYLAGKEITHTDLKHEGTYGTAEITVVAQSGYRLEIIASEDQYFSQPCPCIVYAGLKDGITVAADTTMVVDIAMVDAAPVLYPAIITGNGSYMISWSKVPLAISYQLEESTIQAFTNYSEVYSGPDTTKTFTDKGVGTYYYCVAAKTQYANTSFSNAFSYGGAVSNIIRAGSGSFGTLMIKMPWPTK